jgi:WD40 repeat protein
VVYAVEWLPDGETLAMVCLDGTAVALRIEADEVISWNPGHSRGITSVCLLSAPENPGSGLLAVTGSIDQTLRVTDLLRDEGVRSLDNHTGAVHSVSVRPAVEGIPVISSIADDRTVRFWQPTIGRMMRFARLPAVPLCQVWLGRGESLAVGCADGHLRVIDPDTVQILRDEPVDDVPLTELAAHPESESVAVGTFDGRLRLLHLQK